MNVGVAFSGGKDSCYACYWALNQGWDVTCLLTVIPDKPESYMFHYPNVFLTEHQAKAIGIPRLTVKTTGEKEKELQDLKHLLENAEKKHGIQGVVSGAVASEYQKTRMDTVTHELGLKHFAPLWHKPQATLIRDEVRAGFEIVIVGVYAEGLDDKWLGRVLDDKALNALKKLGMVSQVGEGGEFETTVLDGPIFKKPVRVKEVDKKWDGVRGQIFLKAD
jgi:ABC transporter with metal-binding/Fe-S-binding domain ATP-binding protein